MSVRLCFTIWELDRRKGFAMPIHDWSRVPDWVFHDFHLSWIAKLWNTLNADILSRDHYAMLEEVASLPGSGPPKSQASLSEAERLTRHQRSVVVRREIDEGIIAVIEILSAGNKSSPEELRAFVSKAAELIDRGCHLLLIDLHPRTSRDPQGIHPIIWTQVGGTSEPLPEEKPLTLVVYEAGPPRCAYLEPAAVGDVLSDMPLFLAPYSYISIPLEATYQAAFRGVPRRFREALESPAGSP